MNHPHPRSQSVPSIPLSFLPMEIWTRLAWRRVLDVMSNPPFRIRFPSIGLGLTHTVLVRVDRHHDPALRSEDARDAGILLLITLHVRSAENTCRLSKGPINASISREGNRSKHLHP